MIDPKEIEKRARRLEKLFEDRLRLRSGTLELRGKRARRHLNRATRRDLAMLSNARVMAQNPKLSRQLDAGKIRAAFDRAEAQLGAIDRFDMQKGKVLSVLAGISLSLILCFALFLGVLLWRGFL